MAEVKGGTKINIKGQQVGIFYTFSGHVPSPDMEAWLTKQLRIMISKALMAAPDLAAAAQNPASVAQQVMQTSATELMQQGIVGALTIDGIKLPAGGAPANGGEERRIKAELAYGQGKALEVDCVFKGESGSASSVEEVVVDLLNSHLMGLLGNPPRVEGVDLTHLSNQLNERAQRLLGSLGLRGRIEIVNIVDAGGQAPPLPQLTPEQYASLCAEREQYPAHVAQINAKYGITDPAVAAALDQQWQGQLQSDPSVQQRYQQGYWQYKAWLQSQQQQ